MTAFSSRSLRSEVRFLTVLLCRELEKHQKLIYPSDTLCSHAQCQHVTDSYIPSIPIQCLQRINTKLSSYDHEKVEPRDEGTVCTDCIVGHFWSANRSLLSCRVSYLHR